MSGASVRVFSNSTPSSGPPGPVSGVVGCSRQAPKLYERTNGSVKVTAAPVRIGSSSETYAGVASSLPR